jgi:outer membrane protein assembly factor BamB
MNLPRAILAALAATAAAALLTAGDSPTHRADPQRSGATPELLPPQGGPILTIAWQFQANSSDYYALPTIAGNRVYTAGNDGRVRALDRDTGALLWETSVGGPSFTAPTYYAGRLYAGSYDGHLYALHAATGEILWSVLHGGMQTSTPAVALVPGPNGSAEPLVIFGVGAPTLSVRAYHAITGQFWWEFAAGQPVSGAVAFDPGTATTPPKAIFADNVGSIYAVHAWNGTLLWSYTDNSTRPEGAHVVPVVWGNWVLVSRGGYDRYLRVLDRETGQLVKQVFVWPPGATKPGGGTPQEPEPPAEMPALDQDTIFGLLGLPKAERDAYLDELAAAEGVSYDAWKEWFDYRTGEAQPGTAANSAPGTVNLDASKPVVSSPPSVAVDPVSGKFVAVVTQREVPDPPSDVGDFFTVGIDPDPAVAGSSSVLWGQPPPETLTARNLGFHPSPVVTAGQYVYYTHGSKMYVRVLNGLPSDPPLGSVDLGGGGITGGVAGGNGYVVVTTRDGRTIALKTGNTPPWGPTFFNPAGGQNVTSTNAPTLFWSGHGDVQTPADQMVSQVEFATGWWNADLEVATQKETITLPAGGNDYTIPPQPPNTHVFWRVRVRDAHGAWSGWSPVQDFWVDQDTTPPAPPEGVVAVAGDGKVTVSWNPSPSPDVVWYRLRWKKSSDPWSAAVLVDQIAASPQTVTGLVNGTWYDFMVSAVDAGENESTGVVVSAKPQGAITIGGGGPSYPTIQAALNAAPQGATVVVVAGTYYEDLVVPAGVSLEGAGANLTFIIGDGVGPVIQVSGTSATPTTISGLNVTNGTTGIDAGAADVVIHHVVVHSIQGSGIVGGAAGSLEVRNCTVMENAADGVQAQAAATVVRNTVAGLNGGYGIWAPEGAAVSYNDAWDNAAGDYAFASWGPANQSAAAVFVDPSDGTYLEAVGSPTVDAGDPADEYDLEPAPNGGRINQGAYGNTPYAAKSFVPSGAAGGGGGGGGGGGLGACWVPGRGASWGWLVLLMALALPAGLRGRGLGVARRV